MKAAIIIIVVISVANALTIDANPFSDEFIQHINSKQSSWRAGRNFDEKTIIDEFKKKLGAFKSNPKERYQPTKHSEDIDIPESFDARTYLENCTDVISRIADQSECGSCWAVSVTSAMTDRRCIKSNGSVKIPVSAVDLMSCCKKCGKGCQGGYPDEAWRYWLKTGIVTGGFYNSSEGCIPYPFQPCDHRVEGKYIPCSQLDIFDTPKCSKQCTNNNLKYESEITQAESQLIWVRTHEDIQREILLNGPVTAVFAVFADFVNYKSGVYQYVSGSYLGEHAVRIIGWGVENDIEYWLVANSWNEDWGDKGLFKIKKGQVGIEDEIYGAIPKL